MFAYYEELHLSFPLNLHLLYTFHSFTSVHTFIPSTLKTENPAPNNDNAIATLCSFDCLINLTHKESECEYELSPELLRLVEQEAK